MKTHIDNIQMRPGKKSRLHVLLCLIMVLPAAFLFSVRADVPHVLLIATMLSSLTLFIRKPFPYTDRYIIYSILSSIVVAFLFDLVFKIEKGRMGIFSEIFMSNIATPSLIYIAILATFFETSPYTLGLSISCTLIALASCGDISYNTTASVRFPYGNILTEHILTLYTFIIDGEGILMILALGVAQKIKINQKDKYIWYRRTCKFLAILLIPILTTIGCRILLKNESTLRTLEEKILSLARRFRNKNKSKILFGDKVNLNQTTPFKKGRDQNAILLRVDSKNPPGYLRGNVYTRYKSGEWKKSEEVSRYRLKGETHGNSLAYKTFSFSTKEKGDITYTIYPSVNFLSQVLFIPGNGTQLDIIADSLLVDSNGVVAPEEWERGGGYTVHTKSGDSMSSYPLPKKSVVMHRELPRYMFRQLSKIANTIIKNDYPNRKPSDKEKINSLLNFFSRNFTYKLNTKNKVGVDPIIYFLTEKRKGHCELFASAMALLLRTQRIPTRYITGFTCFEKHPFGGYYISRLGNAHAWIEAYLKKEKRWVLVEATPPSGIPKSTHKWGTFEKWSDQLAQKWANIMLKLRRGYFAEAIGDMFRLLFDIIITIIWNPVRGTLLLLLIIGISFWIIQRRKKRNAKQFNLVGLQRSMQKEMQIFEKKIAKQIRYQRKQHETIEQWIDEISKHKKLPQATQDRLLKAITYYNERRFGEKPFTKEELNNFKKELKQLRIELQNASTEN